MSTDPINWSYVCVFLIYVMLWTTLGYFYFIYFEYLILLSDWVKEKAWIDYLCHNIYIHVSKQYNNLHSRVIAWVWLSIRLILSFLFPALNYILVKTIVSERLLFIYMPNELHIQLVKLFSFKFKLKKLILKLALFISYSSYYYYYYFCY